MAYVISKADDAPEGTLKVAIGSKTFRVKDDAPFETDDASLVENVRQMDNSHLVIEQTETGENPTEAGRAESKAINELHKEQDKAKMQHATKDPYEAAAPVPTSVADLQEIKAEEAADDSKGDKN